MLTCWERYNLSLFNHLGNAASVVFFLGPVLTKKQLQSIIPLLTLNKTLLLLSQRPPLWEGGTRPVILVWQCLFMNYFYYLDFCKSTLKRCFWKNSLVRFLIPGRMTNLLTALSVGYRIYILQLKTSPKLTKCLESVTVELKMSI